MAGNESSTESTSQLTSPTDSTVTPYNPPDLNTNVISTPTGVVPTETASTPNQIPTDTKQPAAKMQAPPPSAPKTDYSQHPLNQKVGLLHTLAETLAGGPKVNYRRDVNTGEMVATKKHLSTGEIGMGIVAAALMGALGGAGQRGPGAGARGFAAGGQAVMQKNEQIDEQQKQKADKDFASYHAAMEANLRMMNTAIDIGRKDKEDHDSMVASYNDALGEYTGSEVSSDFVKGTGISEKDAQDFKKYPIGMLRIPDKTVPRIGQDGKQIWLGTDGKVVPEGTPGAHRAWDNTYTIIDKDAPIKLTDDDGKIKSSISDAVKWGLLPESVLKASDHPIPAYVAMNPVHQAVMLNSIDKELKDFSAKTKTPEIDLKKQIKDNPKLMGALQDFQRSAGTSTQVDRQLDVMRQDPKTKPGSADLMMNLLGKDNLEAFKSKREATDEENKSKANAQGKLDVENTPEALHQAELKTKMDALARAEAEESTPEGKARLTREILENRKLRDDLDNEKATKTGVIGQVEADGVNHVYLNSLAPSLQATVQAIGEGRVIMSPRNLASKYGASLQAAVNQAYPGYDFTKADSYERMKRDFISGDTSKALQAFSTALGHLNRLKDHATILATTPGVSNVAAALGDKNSAAIQDDIAFITEELAKAYKTGVPDKDEVNRIQGLLKAGPMSIRTHINEIANLLGGQFTSIQNKWNNGIPSTFVNPVPNLISPEAKQAYKNIVGKPIFDPVPKGKFAVSDQKGQVIGYADDAQGINYKPVSE